MGRKQELIDSIKKLIAPPQLMAKSFIQEGHLFRHEGKLLTRDQCRKVPARIRYFIVPASRGDLK